MNRTGLYVALGLSLAVGLLFGIFPELDLQLAALFFNPDTKLFSLRSNDAAKFVRGAAMWIAWAIAAPSLVALALKLVRPDRPLLVGGRSMMFLLISIAMAAGVLTNLTFKSHWGRPRPIFVTEFSGQQQFMPWWDPRGECPKNCSFFSGEGATAFWTFAPAALTPPPWRPLAYAAAATFGGVTSVLRMAFGGHFFSDVAIAGLVTYLVIWLLHGWIYRWPSTRFSDAGIDTVLTRFAWPFYRLRQKWRGRDVGPAPAASATVMTPVNDSTRARRHEV